MNVVAYNYDTHIFLIQKINVRKPIHYGYWELSDSLCDSVNRGLTLVSLQGDAHRNSFSC